MMNHLIVFQTFCFLFFLRSERLLYSDIPAPSFSSAGYFFTVQHLDLLVIQVQFKKKTTTYNSIKYITQKHKLQEKNEVYFSTLQKKSSPETQRE